MSYEFETISKGVRYQIVNSQRLPIIDDALL